MYLENEVDKNAVTEFKQQHNNNKPILELWPQSVTRRSLNDSQLYSISLAMKNDFQLIQGPPGSSKLQYSYITYVPMYVCNSTLG